MRKHLRFTLNTLRQEMILVSDGTFPVVVLLLDSVRRVGVEEACRIVKHEHGESAAETVRLINEGCEGMQYIDWHFGKTPYHIGTSSEPYINAVGEGKYDKESGVVGQLKWKVWEELPPQDDADRNAWMSHTAWMYVDALLFHPLAPEENQRHIQHVLRIAARLVDSRCVLLWLWGPRDQSKRVALPTPATLATLRHGAWPE